MLLMANLKAVLGRQQQQLRQQKNQRKRNRHLSQGKRTMVLMMSRRVALQVRIAC
jgi:hypothetical protein